MPLVDLKNHYINWFNLDKQAGHSSGWAAFGHNKGLDPSMPCLTLMYLVIFDFIKGIQNGIRGCSRLSLKFTVIAKFITT